MKAQRNSMNRLLDKSKSTRSSARAGGARRRMTFKENMLTTQTSKNPLENDMLKKQQGLDDLEVFVGVSAKEERDRYAICSPGISKAQLRVTDQTQAEKGQRSPNNENLNSEPSQGAIVNCYNSNLNAQLNIVAPSSYQSMGNLMRPGGQGATTGWSHPSQGALEQRSKNEIKASDPSRSQRNARGQGRQHLSGQVPRRLWRGQDVAGCDSTDGSSLSNQNFGSMAMLKKQRQVQFNRSGRNYGALATHQPGAPVEAYDLGTTARNSAARRAIELYRGADVGGGPASAEQQQALSIGSRVNSSLLAHAPTRNSSNKALIHNITNFDYGALDGIGSIPSAANSQLRRMPEAAIQSEQVRSRPTTAKNRSNQQTLSGANSGIRSGNLATAFSQNSQVELLAHQQNVRSTGQEALSNNYQSASQLDFATQEVQLPRGLAKGHQPVQVPKSATQPRTASRPQFTSKLRRLKKQSSAFTRDQQRQLRALQNCRILERENEMEELDTLSQVVINHQRSLLKKASLKDAAHKGGYKNNRPQTAKQKSKTTLQSQHKDSTGKLDLTMEQKRKSAQQQQNQFLNKRSRFLKNEDLISKDTQGFNKDPSTRDGNESHTTLVRYRDCDSRGGSPPESTAKRLQVRKSTSPPDSPLKARKSSAVSKLQKPEQPALQGGHLSFSAILKKEQREKSPPHPFPPADSSPSSSCDANNQENVYGLNSPGKIKNTKCKMPSHGGLSEQAQEINSNLCQNMTNLQTLQEDICIGRDPHQAQFKKYLKVDCSSRLSDAKKSIKVIQYQCNTTVARENERIVNIKPPNMEAGKARGPDKVVDIIEECELICKVEVAGRKAPLKINIDYEVVGGLPTKDTGQGNLARTLGLGKQFSSQAGSPLSRSGASPKRTALVRSTSKIDDHECRGEKFPDLKIYVSNESKAPNAMNSFQTFVNPGCRIFIKKPERDAEMIPSTSAAPTRQAALRQERDSEDTFQSKSIYLCFISSKNLSLSLSCSFPNQGVPDQKKINAKAMLTSKDLRDKFRRQVQEKMDEIESSLNAHKQYFNDIALIKRRRQLAGLRSRELNYIERNVDQIQDMQLIKEQQHLARQQVVERIEDARLRRLDQEDQRQVQNKFDLIKWDLYRLKCDQIDEEYAMFKKRQVKIFWWLQLIMVHVSYTRLMKNFIKYRQLVFLERLKLRMQRRIYFWYRRQIRRKGQDFEYRYLLTIKSSLTLLSLTQVQKAQRWARPPFLMFLQDTADLYYMKRDFRSFYAKCLKIQDAVKWIEEVRVTRRKALEKFFEKERSHMTKYYVDKAKKNKKFKAIFNQLAKLSEENKHLILRNYYENKVACENLQNAIYACVKHAVKSGKRPPEIADYVTEEEHKNLVALERNISLTTAFLFKGVKEAPAVGGEDEIDIYDLNNRPKKDKVAKERKEREKREAESKQGASSAQEKSGVAFQTSSQALAPTVQKSQGADGEEDDAMEGEEGGEDQMSAMADSDMDDTQQQIAADSKGPMQNGAAKAGKGPPPASTGPKGGKKAKPEKPASGKSRAASQQASSKKPAQREATSSSPPASKKGKRKKNKETKVDLPWTVPAEVGRCNRFLPSRATMQRLVMRAATMKEKERELEPVCQEVRPWERIQNRDFLEMR